MDAWPPGRSSCTPLCRARRHGSSPPCSPSAPARSASTVAHRCGPDRWGRCSTRCRQLGATVTEEGEPGHLPVTVSGGATGVGPGGERGFVHLPGDVSSQFVSGLLIAGACLPGGLRVELSTDPVSRPYLDMTIAVMAAFGVIARAEGPRAFVVEPGGYCGHHLRDRAGRLGRLLPLRRRRRLRWPGPGRRPGPRIAAGRRPVRRRPRAHGVHGPPGRRRHRGRRWPPARHRRRLRADLRHRPDHRRGRRLRRGSRPGSRGSASSAARRPTASPRSSPSCAGPASTRWSRTTASSSSPGPCARPSSRPMTTTGWR